MSSISLTVMSFMTKTLILAPCNTGGAPVIQGGPPVIRGPDLRRDLKYIYIYI